MTAINHGFVVFLTWITVDCGMRQVNTFSSKQRTLNMVLDAELKYLQVSKESVVVGWDGRLGGHNKRRPSPEFYILFILLTILGLVRSAEYSPLGPDLQLAGGSS